MKYHQLDITSKKTKKRVGRGTGSGYGKTAGRGTKGQNARTGGGVRIGFEGGQNPLMKRLPKTRGFRSHPKQKTETIHTDQLNEFRAKSTVGNQQLKEAGLISRLDSRVKLLTRGELNKELTLDIDSASASAKKVVEAAGGSIKDRT